MKVRDIAWFRNVEVNAVPGLYTELEHAFQYRVFFMFKDYWYKTRPWKTKEEFEKYYLEWKAQNED